MDLVAMVEVWEGLTSRLDWSASLMAIFVGCMIINRMWYSKRLGVHDTEEIGGGRVNCSVAGVGVTNLRELVSEALPWTGPRMTDIRELSYDSPKWSTSRKDA